MQRKIFCLIGGSGSGKDTQGNLLAKRFGLEHISMGGILRSEAKKGNPIAVKAQEVANQGKWVDGDTVAKLLTAYMLDLKGKGLILNGFPRSDDQRQYFPAILEETEMELVAVIHLEVSDEVLIQRMEAQVEEGQEREDTTPEIMAQRLKSYKDTIDPILQGYKENGQLVNINGENTPEQVHQDILSSLEGKVELQG